MADFGDFNTSTQWSHNEFQGSSSQGGFVAQSRDDDDLNEEEQSMVAAVEIRNQQRKQELYLKQQAEESAKRDRKSKAETDLGEWQKTRQAQIQLRRTNNVEQEK